jgi:hypothetical protein
MSDCLRASRLGGPVKRDEKRDNMRAVLGLTLLALGACSATLPVSGSMEDGSETFTGTSIVNGDPTGTLMIKATKACLARADGAT